MTKKVSKKVTKKLTEKVTKKRTKLSTKKMSKKVSKKVSKKKKRKPVLTKAQKDIVNFCSVPRTAQEILERLGLSNHSANRKRHIQTLVDMGVLEMTIPEKPNDRNQKYRKKKK